MNTIVGNPTWTPPPLNTNKEHFGRALLVGAVLEALLVGGLIWVGSNTPPPPAGRKKIYCNPHDTAGSAQAEAEAGTAAAKADGASQTAAASCSVAETSGASSARAQTADSQNTVASRTGGTA